MLVIALCIAGGSNRFSCVCMSKGSYKIRLEIISACLTDIKGIALLVAGGGVLSCEAFVMLAVFRNYKYVYKYAQNYKAKRKYQY